DTPARRLTVADVRRAGPYIAFCEPVPDFRRLFRDANRFSRQCQRVRATGRDSADAYAGGSNRASSAIVLWSADWQCSGVPITGFLRELSVVRRFRAAARRIRRIWRSLVSAAYYHLA